MGYSAKKCLFLGLVTVFAACQQGYGAYSGGESDSAVAIVSAKSATLDSQSNVSNPQSPPLPRWRTGAIPNLQSTDEVVAGKPADETVADNSCGPSPMLPVKVCEEGAGFLCIDTPPGGVTDDYATVHGRVDIKGGTFSGLKVVAQHNATKGTQEVPATIDENGIFSARIGLLQLGSYTVSVQAFRAGGDPAIESVHLSRVIAPKLVEKGVSLGPTPASGRISADHVTVTVDLLPDCDQCDMIGSLTGATYITVINEIVGSGGETQRVARTTNVGADGRYSICVPLGVGNNSLVATACNAATGLDPAKCPNLKLPSFAGGLQEVDIKWRLPDGMDVPVFDSQKYPETIPLAFSLDGMAFQETKGVCKESAVMFEWNRDVPVPLCVENGLFHAQVKPNPGINLGVVHIKVGKETIDRPVTVAWGEIDSPWSAPGILKPAEENWYLDSMMLGVRQAFLAETMRSIINHVAASDRLEDFLKKTIDQPHSGGEGDVRHEGRGMWDVGRENEVKKRIDEIKATIPQCGATTAKDDPFSQLRIRIIQPPSIGHFEITRISFAQDVTKLAVEMRDVSVAIQLYRDEDDDNVPNHKVLPLKLAFRKLAIEPEIRLVRGTPPQVLLTSPNNDCSYKSGTYCTKRPTIIRPQDFVGGATPSGGFILCDHEDQAVDESTAEGCKGLNILNSATGLFSEKVLDAINQKAYCDGSAMLTYVLREGFQDLRLHVGCRQGEVLGPPALGALQLALWPCGSEGIGRILSDRHWEFPFGLDLVHSIFTLNEQGMSARVASRVGSPEFYSGLPAELQRPTTGYIDDPGPVKLPADLGLSGLRDITLGASEGLFNQALFLAAMQGGRDPGKGASEDSALPVRARGLSGGRSESGERVVPPDSKGIFDWDIHEPFYKKLGFDFVEKCDGFIPSPLNNKPPTLCNLRPRVGELLGTALTSSGYFPQKQPLMMRLRGNRSMTPHVRLYRADVPAEASGSTETAEIQATRNVQIVELQLPNIEVGFYALATDPAGKVDAYGNLPLEIDQPHSDPVILSMRPNDPNTDNGAIIRFYMTALVAFELGDIETDPNDPGRWTLTVKTNPHLSRFSFDVLPGGNATIVRSSSLLSAFREKILYGVTIYGSDRDPLRIGLSKRLFISDLVGEKNNLMNLFGLEELRVGKEGLTLGIDEGQDYLTLGLNLFVTQRLVVDGETKEWQLPAP